MAAAPADFTPAEPVSEKIKKDEHDAITVELARTDDIIAGLAGRRRPGQTLVGFAAEHGEGAVAYGRDKLERKRLDAVVVNDIARDDIGFDTDANEVTIVTAAGERAVPRASKADVARAVLDVVDELRMLVEPSDRRRRWPMERAARAPPRSSRRRARSSVGSRPTSRARSRSATRSSSTCSSRCSPRATS